MSVEAKIKEMLLSSQKNLNEVASSGSDSTPPKQGSSKDASFEDLGNLDNVKPKVTTGKDGSKSAKASTSGDGQTKPKQGSSKEASTEDLDDMKSGVTASSKMSKDTSLTPKIKGDATNDMQGSSKKATWTEVGEDEEHDEEDSLDDSEEFDDDEEIDEETLDELSKKTLGSYINKANRDSNMASRVAANKNAHNLDSSFENKEVRKRKSGISTAVKKLTKEEIESIFGSDITEEFQNKATEIFEAAVIARVNDEMIAIEEELNEVYTQALEEAIEDQKTELTEKLNLYIDHIADQWMDENEIAIENGLKLETMESFMDSLKVLFNEHYIEVPDEKVDVLEVMQSQIDSLEARLNEEINKNIESAELVKEANRLEIFDEATKGLADTEIERFEKLVEGIEFDDPDLYAQKLAVIRKSHFSKHIEEGLILESDDAPVKVNNDRMSKYAEAISRSVKK